jgi:hypothetical protein
VNAGEDLSAKAVVIEIDLQKYPLLSRERKKRHFPSPFDVEENLVHILKPAEMFQTLYLRLGEN